MIWLAIVLLVVIGCFAAVLINGAPYLPTLRPQIGAALELADLKPGQTMIELGAGDGRVAMAAASRGYKVIAYELNPLLAALMWVRTRRYRQSVKIVWGDFWRHPLPPAEAIFTFLLPKYMSRLDEKIHNDYAQPVRLVSFAFKIPDRSIDAEKDGVFLYKYH